jgi:hypothetical protein
MKNVRIEQGRHRGIVVDHGDMGVQNHNGGCTFVLSFTEVCLGEEMVDGDRRQFADWLEELYNDILELIVSSFPPSNDSSHSAWTLKMTTEN